MPFFKSRRRSVPSNGWDFYIQGEEQYFRKEYKAAFQCYQCAIEMIIRSEHIDALAHFPVPQDELPSDMPLEKLAVIWQHFIRPFRDPNMNFTRATEPTGFMFLSKFCISSADLHPEFRTSAARHILRAMQVQAGLTLGILAWEEGDRDGAVERFQEALSLANSIPEFRIPNPSAQHLDLTVQKDVLKMRRRVEEVLKEIESRQEDRTLG